MNVSFGVISHATGGLVYILISALLARGQFRRSVDRSLLAACGLTAVWMLVLAAQAAWGVPSFAIRYTTEVLHNAGWISVLFIILGIGQSPHRVFAHKLRYGLAVAVSAVLVIMLVVAITFGLAGIRIASGNVLVLGQVMIAIAGLVLLEQVWRSEAYYKRSNVRYFCLGTGAMFAYDFVLYSDALLFHQMSSALWDCRGIVVTLCAPLIAMTLVNSSRQPIDVQVSRQFVFHSSVLLFTGAYLLIVAAGGYYIKKLGGAWSEALLVLFFFSAVLGLATLGSSPRLRARLFVFISQNFFDYKYDYREEWIRVTRTVTQVDDTYGMEQRVIRLIADLVGSPGGAIWLQDDLGDYVIRDVWNLSERRHHRIPADSELIRLMSASDWIIDLNEYQADPTRYGLVEIPECIPMAPEGWMLVPLVVRERLFGFVFLVESRGSVELNWENFDLMKIVARQAGSYLALMEAQDSLSESRQFEAVNRALAFTVHDLKTMVAQLSLLVGNAEKHKSNPAFIDDMVLTASHTVNKMNHLLQQMRNPGALDIESDVDLPELLQEVIIHQARQLPAPTLNSPVPFAIVRADRVKLREVLVHLIQNAQDATPREGEVSLTLRTSAGWAVIFVQDNGRGMSPDFVERQLFKPFKSTKGLTGMGIGAHQSREYVRRLGGNIEVTSEPGMGTCFTVKLPSRESSSPAAPAAVPGSVSATQGPQGIYG